MIQKIIQTIKSFLIGGYEENTYEDTMERRIQTEDVIYTPPHDTNIDNDLSQCLYHVEDNADNVLDEDCCLDTNSRLINDLAKLVIELDEISNRITDINLKEFIEFTQGRLIEIALNNGAQEQTDNTTYNVIKHLPVPYKIVDCEAKINSVIRPGLIYNGKVILKSIVTIEE